VQLREKMVSVIPGLKHSFIALVAALLACSASPIHAAAATAADEKAGAVLFRDKGCAYCHGVGGTGGKKAPTLVDLRKNKLWPPEKITEQILNGGQKMPPFADSLTDQEVAQLVAYLRARVRPVPPPVAAVAPAVPAAEPPQ
jgi:mono/diheme cytochrome c family protein